MSKRKGSAVSESAKEKPGITDCATLVGSTAMTLSMASFLHIFIFAVVIYLGAFTRFDGQTVLNWADISAATLFAGFMICTVAGVIAGVAALCNFRHLSPTEKFFVVPGLCWTVSCVMFFVVMFYK